ncbi:MAG: flagellar basal body P-ring formation chaperone FlgA [Pseudomonadota bacterium]
MAFTSFAISAFLAATQLSTLIATEVIRSGDAITTANTVPAESNVTESDSVLLGREVRRTVYKGQPIRFSNTTTPKLVSRNQLVTVKYTTGSMEISLTGRAMGDAGAGDPISVLNTDSRKRIEGFVTEEGWVRVK